MARLPRLGALVVLLTVLAAPGRMAANTPFVVNSAADLPDANPGDGVCETAPGNGVCTLRAAIEEANALPGADTITFSSSLPNPATFDVLTTFLRIDQDLTIIGRGESSTIIDAVDSSHRALVVFTATATISGLTIQHGGVLANNASTVLHLSNVTLTNSTGIGGLATNGTTTLDHCTVSNNSSSSTGGGIYNTGTLTVTSSTIQGNSSQLDGGGLYSLGTATITSSTIDSNSSQAGGGGIYAPAVTLQNVTVSRNLASSSGGGIFLFDSGVSNLINSTVTANEALGAGGGVLAASAATVHAYNSTITSNKAGVSQMGGGIFLTGSGSSIANTIVALNYRMSKTGNVPTDCAGTLMSLDYNLIQTLTDCTITGAAANNVYGADPNLGALQNNGGRTQTEALLTGSPAIDKGNPSGCTDNFGATLTTDQRGFLRPVNGRCDMGAYEFGSVQAFAYFTLPPCRVVDTRGADGPALAAGTTRSFALAGKCGLPTSANAVSLNVTVTQPTAQGDLRLFPGGAPLPLVSTINYRAGQTRANNAIVTLGPSNDIDVLSDQSSGTVHFIVDVNGYFQ
jgi:CSLREA domain-containing protein